MKRVAIPVAIVVGLALVPKFSIDIPYLFGGGLNTPGTLQLLALCLLFGGLALSYDLLFGFTGLLSFGHALYFAIGVYVAAIAMTAGTGASGRRSCSRPSSGSWSPPCSARSRCASAASPSPW